MRFLKYGALTALVLGLAVFFGLAPLLVALGLHPHYELPKLEMSGQRALVVTTSHDTLGDTGEKTGVFASEMTAPYYAFLDLGMTVDVASIRGGKIPIQPGSDSWPLASEHDKRFLKDPAFLAKVEKSLSIEEIDIDDYDIVFLAGGWGAAYDLAQSATLGRKMTQAYAGGAVVGGVCHGPLGLLQAKAEDGKPLVKGRRLTAVTDKQVHEFGITHTPKHPERDLRAAGAVFESKTAFLDSLANHVVVDGRIVTGQNQNGGTETAVKMMQILIKSPREK